MIDESKEVFICYETTTGLNYAKHLKEAIKKMKMSAFVAEEDIKIGETEREIIDKAIIECNYFIVIVTNLAIESEEVKREIEFANSLNKTIIPCKDKEVNRTRLSRLLIINKLQQIDFENKEELANIVVSEIIKNKKFKINIESNPPGADIHIKRID